MTPPLPPSRRAFLLAAGAASAAGATAAAGAVSVVRGPRADEAEDLEAFGRLADLTFTAKERTQAKARLGRQRAGYGELRARDVPFALPPCATFDPLPPAVPPPPAEPGASTQFEKLRAMVTLSSIDGKLRAEDLPFASVWNVAKSLRFGTTSRSLTELALARLKEFDPVLHCTVTLLEKEALARADAMDAELRAGKDRGPLHGIPFGAKDLFAWPSAPTTFGAEPYKDHVWNETATVLQKLHDAGAVLVAKLSLGALAMGDRWFGGRTRSPWDPEKGSSGSSAGSAAAVAAGLLPFALGTETLGSIVSPCRACGVGGLRPTFGTVSRHGAMPLSWTMDKVGVIARDAVTTALVFDAIRGADGKDPAARTAAFPWSFAGAIDGLRVGVLPFGREGPRPEDKAFLDWLGEKGIATKEAKLPDAPYQALLLMLHAEAAAAFDDLTRTGGLARLSGQDENDWPNQFRAARAIPAVEYTRASRLRARLIRDMAEVFAPFDVLVGPTHGGPTLACTNLTGHPALVLPVGADAKENGRPTVLGLIGRLYGEADLLHLAAAWQRETKFHEARPKLSA